MNTFLRRCALICSAIATACLILLVGQARAQVSAASIGSGDDRIRIIPSLSALSCKNGEKLTIGALVKAPAGVARVEATILPVFPARASKGALGLTKIELKPAPANLGGVNAEQTIGLWQADWIGAGLVEGYYQIAIRVEDREGRAFADSSLRFTDPVAGVNIPGTTDYPEGGMKETAQTIDESYVRCGVIDAAAGYAYFGAGSGKQSVVKVALGTGSTAPVRIGAVVIGEAGESVLTAVIDPAAGYAYFGISKDYLGYIAGETHSPARIVKVALGAGAAPPSVVASLTLNPEEAEPISSVIDAANGYAYFGVRSVEPEPVHIVKIALGAGPSAPVRVSALALRDGEDTPSAAMIDAANGLAYFTVNSYFSYKVRSRIVKVALGDGPTSPTRLSAMDFATDGPFSSAAIDAAAGYAYLGSGGSPGRVAKVALGAGATSPTQAGSIALANGENQLATAAIDPAKGYVYFGTLTDNEPSYVVKVSLGAGAASPIRIGAAAVNILHDANPYAASYDGFSSSVIDPANGYAYFGTASSGHVAKIALGTGNAAPAPAAMLELNDALSNYYSSSVVDLAAGYAYLGGYSVPGRITKIRLGSGATPSLRVGTLFLNNGEDYLTSAVIDPAKGYAYFGTETSPGRIVKIALGVGSALPTRIGALTLRADEDNLQVAAIDPAKGLAYFCSNGQSPKIIKIALGTGSNAPSRIGAINTPDGGRTYVALIDSAAGYGYFGGSRLNKIALGSGTALPRVVGGLDLEHGLDCGAIDPASGIACLGMSDYYEDNDGAVGYTGYIAKVKLGAGAAAPSLLGYSAGGSGTFGHYFDSVGLDPAGGAACFIGENEIVNAKWGAALSPPEYAGTLELYRYGDSYPLSGYFNNALGIDSNLGFAWFSNQAGGVSCVALHQRHFIKMDRFELHEPARVQKFTFFSHQAAGHLRLALYQAESPTLRTLVWQSNVVGLKTATGMIEVPISYGVPSAPLSLGQGTYHLAWQIDTNTDVPSYSAAEHAGDGSFLAQPFGPFPSQMKAGDAATSWTTTNEAWTEFMTYDSLNGVRRDQWIGY